MKRRRRSKMLIGLIAVVVVVGASFAGGLFFTEGERREAKNLPIGTVNFKQLNDGIYVGAYEGGMYKWRANKVQVTVSSGKVEDIKLVESTEKQPSQYADEMFARVTLSQSLQVDAVSGATLTSKAYLKAVENALDKAKKK